MESTFQPEGSDAIVHKPDAPGDPWRVEFTDGEIILVKQEARARIIAELVPRVEKVYGLSRQQWLDSQKP